MAHQSVSDDESKRKQPNDLSKSIFIDISSALAVRFAGGSNGTGNDKPRGRWTKAGRLTNGVEVARAYVRFAGAVNGFGFESGWGCGCGVRTGDIFGAWAFADAGGFLFPSRFGVTWPMNIMGFHVVRFRPRAPNGTAFGIGTGRRTWARELDEAWARELDEAWARELDEAWAGELDEAWAQELDGPTNK